MGSEENKAAFSALELRPRYGYRMVPTTANREPAALFGPAVDSGGWDGVQLLNLDADDRIRLVPK